MRAINANPSGRLIVAIMYRDTSVLDNVVNKLCLRFGNILDVIEYDFSFTNYYEKEFGTDLKKRLLVFDNELALDDLPGMKVFTNDLEQKFVKRNKRLVNIDPGYMTHDQVVLASTKALAHRAYIGSGMYADIILQYYNGAWDHSEKTFPDFKVPKVKEFLKKHRRH